MLSMIWFGNKETAFLSSLYMTININEASSGFALHTFNNTHTDTLTA